MNSSFELVDEYHSYLERKIMYCQPNLHKTSGLLSIIFVILTCSHLMTFLEKKIIYCLNQTCKRLQIFVISYLLFWPAFIWRFFGGRKVLLMSCLLKTEWLMKKLIIFISHFVFRRQPAEISSTKKFVKWKQFKTTNMILQRSE